LQEEIDHVEQRTTEIERYLRESDEQFAKGGPFTSPMKQMKYLEKRIVLSEQALIKQEQVLNLVRQEKSALVQ
jgi:hypothetical protein